MRSPRPLSLSKILKNIPTDKSIAEINRWTTYKEKLEGSIYTRSDAIVWGNFHKSYEHLVFCD